MRRQVGLLRIALEVVALGHQRKLVVDHVEISDGVISRIQHVLDGAVRLQPAVTAAAAAARCSQKRPSTSPATARCAENGAA